MSQHPSHDLRLQLRFGDTDKLGHVNNAVYASYAEAGRLAYFERLGLAAPSVILARLAIDFRRQVVLEDDCTITTRVVRVGNSSIAMTQTLTANGDVAAEFEAVLVWFDYESQRPVRVPEDVRALLSGRAKPDASKVG